MRKILFFIFLFFLPFVCKAETAPPKKGFYCQNINEVLSLPEKEIDLTTAILLICKEWDKNIDINKYRKQIDDMAAIISDRIKNTNSRDPVDKILAINKYLFEDFSLKIIKKEALELSYQESYSKDETLIAYLLDTKQGQCRSLSHLYLALAEKLELPLYLVHVPFHLFIRYDDGATRFNIETMVEKSGPNDEYYIKWKNINPEAIKNRVYLRNLSKKETISSALDDLARLYVERDIYEGEKDNNLDKCIKIEKESLKLDPKNIDALVRRGSFYAQKFQDLMVEHNSINLYLLDLAVNDFQKALDLDPGHVNALITFALVYRLKGDYKGAEEKLKKALEVAPNYGRIYQELAVLYKMSKNYSLAWEYANKAAKLGWSIPEKDYEEIKKKNQ